MTKLGDSEVQIVVLKSTVHILACGLCFSFKNVTTYSDTGNVRPCIIEKWHHVSSLCDRALQARIEGVTGEKRQKIGELGVLWSGSVMVDERLKALDAPNRV
jgi:hypothetical protein